MLRKNQTSVTLCVVIVVSVLLLYQGSEARETWGLCIGISQYQHEDLRDLKWAGKDAIDFCSLFLDFRLGLSIKNHHILLNSRATGEEILQSLGGLSNEAHTEDRVYIFYSGHGGEASPILPYDVKIDDPTTFLSLEKIIRALNNIPVKEIIFIVDACYSGRLAEKGTGIALNRKELTGGLSKDFIMKMSRLKPESERTHPVNKLQQDGIVIMTSSNGKQTSEELEREMNGLFTYYLKNTLMKNPWQADTDGDGKLTLYELYQNVHNVITEKTTHFKLTKNSLKRLEETTVLPANILKRLKLHLEDVECIGRQKFLRELELAVGKEVFNRYHSLIEQYAEKSGQEPQISDEEQAKQLVLFNIKEVTSTQLVTTPASDFGITQIIMEDAYGKPINPVYGIYQIKQNQSVSLTVDFTKPDKHDIGVAWITGGNCGELSQVDQKITTFLATRPGRDYIKVIVWDRITGTKLPEFPILITVVP